MLFIQRNILSHLVRLGATTSKNGNVLKAHLYSISVDTTLSSTPCRSTPRVSFSLEVGFFHPPFYIWSFRPILFFYSLFWILLRGKISQSNAHRYLCCAFWQVTTEPLHSGTTQPEHRSRTWKTFHNRVHWKQRRAFFAQHSIRPVRGWSLVELTKQSR